MSSELISDWRYSALRNMYPVICMLNMSVARFCPVVVIDACATCSGMLPSSDATVVLTANWTVLGAVFANSPISSFASMSLIFL